MDSGVPGGQNRAVRGCLGGWPEVVLEAWGVPGRLAGVVLGARRRAWEAGRGGPGSPEEGLVAGAGVPVLGYSSTGSHRRP